MLYTKGLTVIVKLWTNILQEKNPGGDGGGSAGASSLLTSFSAGSGPEGAQGGTNTGDTSGGKPATTGDANPPPVTAQSGVKDWRLGLPQELQEDATLRKFSDIPSLAAAYINAQKLIGSDKIAIPGKHASDEDWMDVYKKLGLPEKIDQYDLKINESATIDKEFVNQFKESAYKFGILPGQAQKLADWFSEVNMKAEEKILSENKERQEKELTGLKSEWGKSFEANLSRAHLVLKNFADPETIQHLEDAGLGNDTRLIKLLSKVGTKLYGETKIVGGDSGGAGAITPAEAKKTVDSIMGNTNHPYFQKEHPGHKTAVAEVQKLFGIMYNA